MALQNPVIGSELNDEFDIGVLAPNKVSIKVDNTTVTKNASGQLSAIPDTMVWDNVAKTITYTSAGGTPVVIDLAQFATDLVIEGGSYDAATATLTLTDADANTADVIIDLSTLLGVSTDTGNLLVNGTDGKALFTKSDLDAQTTILLSLFDTPIGRVINI